MRVQATGDAGEKTAEAEGHQFVHGGVDARRFDGQLIFADGMKNDARFWSR
jgi:hypothetical protein